MIDTLVAFIAISLSGVIWRLNAPLDLGIVRATGLAVFIALLLGFTNFIFGLRHVTWRYASSVYVFDIALSTGFTTIILILINQYLFNPPLLPMSLIIKLRLVNLYRPGRGALP